MIRHKYVDWICAGAGIVAVILALLLMNGEKLGIAGAESDPPYASRLFDSGRVHRIDIRTEDWKGFTEQAAQEQYVPCTVEIDGEEFFQVGLRAKGNNSLHLSEDYGLSRYSLKLEFDQFLEGGNYYGLDKFSLDASFQDNSYMKTFLAYDMMTYMEVPAPLCSYVQVTVNGEDWGLFLAVEEPEEAFARRCFGRDYGQLYKPDYRSLEEENPDVALRYTGEEEDRYPGIFENAKFDTTEEDRERVIQALKVLDSGENLETAVNVDEVLRYFAVQVFVMNWDSYVGHTGHNYFLYEEDGILSILPWDYNLAFGTYALGMSEPVRDASLLINWPFQTPAEGEIMQNRPLYHQLMQVEEYFADYRGYMEELVSGYFESGRFEKLLEQTEEMIAPYVKKDPTAYCSYADFEKAADTLERVCLLRAESIRGQIEGEIPATIRLRQENPGAGVDASSVNLEDLGDFQDLEYAREKQNQAVERIEKAGTRE